MKIAIDDKCGELFKALKFDKKYRYIIYKIDKEQIVTEHTGEREQNWSHFLHKLPANQYRFCVFDLEFKTTDGINMSKIIFCSWQPEAKIKIKMLYATGKESFKSYLDLNSKQVNISSVDDYTEEGIIKEFNK